MKDISADDLVKVITACGQAGVRKMIWSGVEISLDPEHAVLPEVNSDPSRDRSSRIHYETKEREQAEEAADDLVLTDPDAWAALGGGSR